MQEDIPSRIWSGVDVVVAGRKYKRHSVRILNGEATLVSRSMRVVLTGTPLTLKRKSAKRYTVEMEDGARWDLVRARCNCYR